MSHDFRVLYYLLSYDLVTSFQEETMSLTWRFSCLILREACIELS